MMYKGGHPVATVPRDGGDYTSLSQNDVNSTNQPHLSGRMSIFGRTMMCKWGHPVATFPSDEGDYTSLWFGQKFCETIKVTSTFRVGRLTVK
eukprot:1967559-Pleurochrysis_carterae.AAC.1